MRIGTAIYEDTRLDADARGRLEAEFSFLNRDGGEMPEKIAAGGLRDDILRTALTGAASGAALFGAGLAGHGMVQGAKSIKEKVGRGKDLQRIMAVYPELKSYPQKEIDLAYNSLRHLNPHFSADPLVGGTLLKQILRSRDPSNPKSLRFEGGLAVDLARSRPRESDVIDRMAVDSFQMGLQGALKDREVRDERAWRKATDTAKREADQAFRTQQADEQRQFQQGQQQAKNEFDRATERLRQRAQGKRDLTQHRRAVDLQKLKGRQTAQSTILKKEIDSTMGYGLLDPNDPKGGHFGPSEAADHLRGQGRLKDILK